MDHESLTLHEKGSTGSLKLRLVRGIIKMTFRLEDRLPETDFKAWSISELRKHHDLLSRQCKWWDRESKGSMISFQDYVKQEAEVIWREVTDKHRNESLVKLERFFVVSLVMVSAH